MKSAIIIFSLLFFIGCDEEERSCTSTVECEDDREMFCDLPKSTTFDDGATLEVRACTYVTYEHCFESIRCK
jgi:hypothetical protein